MANPVGNELVQVIGVSGTGGPAAGTEYFTTAQIASSSVISKLQRALTKMQPLLNPVDQPVLTTQPTITTTYDSTLTNNFTVTNSITNGYKYLNLLGGTPYNEYPGVGGAGVDGWTVNPVNYAGTKYTGQCVFEFFCDAPRIQIRGSQGTARIEVNGQFISKTGTAFASGGGEQQVVLDWSSVRATRLYRVHLGGGQYLTRLAVDALSRVWAPTSQDTVTALFYGDSYTQGTGSSYPDNNYADVACAQLGFLNPIHCALGGTGFVNPGAYTNYIGHISDVVGTNPDCIIIEGGKNDTASSSSAVTTAALAFMKAMRGYFPGVPIFVLGIWAGATGPNAANTSTETAVAAAVTQFNDSLCYFIPVCNDSTGSWVYGTGYQGATNGSGNSDNYVYTDAVHPNDAGHDYFGRRTAKGIRDAILSMTR